ncbi:MAG TPA: CocE/NonD family hydrolase [Dehalococcoidia bacterium]|nr:CocE/NonD family hydrolase [Dehalococcoidia bacterium]
MTAGERSATAAPPRRAGSWQQYDVLVERDVMVATRDGVRLATDLYYPALHGERVAGAWPVILERTPYNKLRNDLVGVGRFFARHGYAAVIQDVRGRFASEGEWYPFANEGEDGVDTVDWIAAQPWCSGKVGTIGLSYSGSDQTAIATLAPEALAAQFVSEGMSNYHTSAMRQGGAMELRFLIYAFHMAPSSPEAMRDPQLRAALEQARADVRTWLGKLPLREGASPLRLLPSYERWVLDVLQHGDYDDYWRGHRGYVADEYYAQHKDVPVCLLSGWYDSYARAVTDNYVTLSRQKRGPVRLIMGPWVHGVATMAQSFSGNVDFGPEAPLDDYNGLRLRWFDRWLKDLDSGVEDEAPVRIFVMGGGSGRRNAEGRLDHGGYWRDEQAWPLARAVPTPFYLHADGSLSTIQPRESQASTTFRFNPLDPAPTIGGNISVGYDVMPNGAFDQRGAAWVLGAKDTLPLSARGDVLVFQTGPLAEPVEVTGPLEVKLWVSTSAVDTDFTAKLLDVYPPSADFPEGYAMNIGDSIARLRYRNGRERGEPAMPGEVYAVTIVPYPTSNVFAAGHRIRLDISSSNFPRFDVNPNTGEPLGRNRRIAIADNTVYHDTARPSQIVLPIVPPATAS